MGAVALVVRQSLEQRRRVDVGPERQEVDGVTARKILCPVLDRPNVFVTCRRVLRNLRHDSLLLIGCRHAMAGALPVHEAIDPSFERALRIRGRWSSTNSDGRWSS